MHWNINSAHRGTVINNHNWGLFQLFSSE